MEALSFSVDKSKYALYLIGSLVFVVGGLWAGASDGELMLWLSVGFFGLCAAVFAWQLLQSGPRLTIDDSGIHDRTLGVGVIEWEDVLDARLTSSGGQPFVSLDLQDSQVYLSRLGAAKRKLASVNKAVGFADLSLNLSGLQDADPVSVAELVRSQAAARRAV